MCELKEFVDKAIDKFAREQRRIAMFEKDKKDNNVVGMIRAITDEEDIENDDRESDERALQGGLEDQVHVHSNTTR